MDALKKIIVGVDGSPSADLAIRRALELAKATGAQLKLVHSLPPLVYPPEAMMVPTFDLEGSRYEAAQQTLRETVARLGSALEGVALETSVVSGTPAETLVELAEKQGAQLIVVGSRGRGTFTRILLGSVADRVAHLSRVSVLVAR